MHNEGRHKIDQSSEWTNPNPFINKIKLSGNGKLQGVTIYNAFGQLVYSNDAMNCPEEIDLSFLKPGIYLISLQGEKDLQKSIKIIKE